MSNKNKQEKPVNGFDINDLAINDSDRKSDIKMLKKKKTLREEIEDSLRIVENFPKNGIKFRDITTFIQNGKLFDEYIKFLVTRYSIYNIEYVVGIESRGFIFGAPLACALLAGFVPIRKKGKLPYKRLTQSYTLEYGEDTLEIHEDAFNGVKGARVLLIDDLVATGGSAIASLKLLNKLEAKIIEFSTLIDLLEFNEVDSRKELKKMTSLYSLIEIEN